MAITRARMSDQIFDEIKKIIKERSFAPGDKFYSENELTRMLQVGRSSVREAVRLLEVSGFVSVQHGRGIFIADPNGREQKAFEEWLRDNESSLSEHFEIRFIIDPKAAGYAAAKADEADVKKLADICGEFAAAAERGASQADIIDIDERFHLALAKSTKNRTLYMIMKTMTSALPEGWISSLHVPGRVGKTVAEHRAIAEAVARRDAAEAERLMEAHLRNAYEDIRASMKQPGEDAR